MSDAGIKYDCTVTPGIDWSTREGITKGSKGSNYSEYNYERQIIENSQIIEYPVSVFNTKKLILPQNKTLKNCLRMVYHFVKKTPMWLRPNTNCNLNEMKHILDVIKKKGYGYAEFMIHSSELMPGGGPQHQGEEQIEILFNTIENLFIYAKKLGYMGYTFDSWEKQKEETNNEVH